ncbi:hypothetical protein MRX96_059829 [Rhipicephalus microplus]
MGALYNALCGFTYNAVDSQTQDKIIQDLQSMNVSTPYAIPDVRLMGRSKSILITFVGTTTLPSSIIFNFRVCSAATRSIRKSRPARTAGLLSIAQTSVQTQVHPLLPLRPGPQDSSVPDLCPMLYPVQRRPRHELAPVQTRIQSDWPVTLVQL